MGSPNHLDAFSMTRTPESSPERGSIGGVRLPTQSLPYRPKMVLQTDSPESSPDRGSGGVILPPARGLSQRVVDVPRITLPKSSTRRGIPDVVGGDGPPVCTPEISFDTAESSTARLPPAKLPRRFFPDNSRSASSPGRSAERSAVSGDGPVPSLRTSLQENQLPFAAQESHSSDLPPYQARPLARRQPGGGMFKRILPSRSRRQRFVRHLKVRSPAGEYRTAVQKNVPSIITLITRAAMLILNPYSLHLSI